MGTPPTFRPMRLVINGRCLARPVSGVERYALGIIGLALQRWPDTRVLVPRGTPVPAGLPARAFVEVGRHRGHRWEQLELPQALDAGDILLSPANTGPWRCRRQALVVHDLAVWHSPAGFTPAFRWWYRLLLPGLVHRCPRVVTVSATMARAITAHFALPTGRVVVVPPVPWDPPPAAPVPQVRADRPFLLAMGAHDPRKGLAQLVAWYLSRQDRPFDLVLLGSAGPAFRSKAPGAGPGVKWAGHVSDARLASLYTGAMALAYPSAYEGFGLPVMEAMLAGCPVIATDLPVLREGFGNAFVPVVPGDPASWDAAVGRVSDAAERERLAAAGMAAVANFGPARTLRALEAALHPWMT